MRATTKDRIRDLADRLCADATIGVAIERLVFLRRIDRGLATADAGQRVDHDAVEREFRR